MSYMAYGMTYVASEIVLKTDYMSAAPGPKIVCTFAQIV
jgi:hypothetical protein